MDNWLVAVVAGAFLLGLIKVSQEGRLKSQYQFWQQS